MKLGIFAKTFARDSIEANLDAVRDRGFRYTQYNFACASLPTLPDAISPNLCRRIHAGHVERGLSMAAISGTFNIIDPDRERLEANMCRFGALAKAASVLGTRIITLCSGTRDMEDMWRRHPDNDTPSAWDEMVTSVRRMVMLASPHDVTIAVEPELSNVINSAAKARKLLDEVQSPHLKIVLDGANLYHREEAHGMHRIIDEAMDLLGPDIVIAHVKDLDGESDHAVRLDYDYYLHALKDVEFAGSLIVHGIDESRAAWFAANLREKLEQE